LSDFITFTPPWQPTVEYAILRGLPVVFNVGGDRQVKDLKPTFISILKSLYKPIVIPFFLLILFLLSNQFFEIDGLFKEKVVL